MKKQAPTYNLDSDIRLRLKQFTDKFIEEGFLFFEKEFKGVEEYIEKAKIEKTKESLRLTPKPKYLLELISFQILDDLNREAFNKTKDTLIVMPDCLSLHNPECEMADTKYGGVCRRCTETCQAYGPGPRVLHREGECVIDGLVSPAVADLEPVCEVVLFGDAHVERRDNRKLIPALNDAGVRDHLVEVQLSI